MLIVQPFHRDAAAGKTPKAVLYPLDVLAQFRLYSGGRLQVVKRNFQR